MSWQALIPHSQSYFTRAHLLCNNSQKGKSSTFWELHWRTKVWETLVNQFEIVMRLIRPRTQPRGQVGEQAFTPNRLPIPTLVCCDFLPTEHAQYTRLGFPFTATSLVVRMHEGNLYPHLLSMLSHQDSRLSMKCPYRQPQLGVLRNQLPDFSNLSVDASPR